MTPELLEKITYLVEKGAKIIGTPPMKSPSLTDYPDCDNHVKELAEKLWGSLKTPDQITRRMGHRKTSDIDIYFVANRTDSFQVTNCMFRAEGEPEIWIGTNGTYRKITDYSTQKGITTIPLEFFPYESYFITFSGNKKGTPASKGEGNFPDIKKIKTIQGVWDVSFDPKWGGPENIKFENLQNLFLPDY